MEIGRSVIINIQIAQDAGEFTEMRAEWTSLFDASSASPFLAWEYMDTWFRSFGGDSTPFVVKAYRGGELIAILPLCRTRRRVLGMSSVQLDLMGGEYGGADHLDIIARPEDKNEAAEAIIRSLSSSGSGTDAISMNNLAAGSPLRDRDVTEAADRPSRLLDRAGYACPQIDLSRGWHRVLSGSRRASNFKRRLKQLENQHGFRFCSVSLPAELDAAFERFLTLHNKRWDGPGGSELSGHASLVDFHRALVRNMAAAGVLRFDELWANGECVASIYGLDNGSTFYYFNAGYDPDWSSMSVGLVLTGLSIRAACDRGRSRYDFLRGEEAYKLDWATHTETLADVLLVRNSIAGKAIAARAGLDQRLRGISHAILPTVVKDWLREWRRLRVRGLRAGTAAST